jgi:hypothetical protein
MTKGKTGETPGGKGPAGGTQTKGEAWGDEIEDMPPGFDGNIGTRHRKGFTFKTLDLSSDPDTGTESEPKPCSIMNHSHNFKPLNLKFHKQTQQIV